MKQRRKILLVVMTLFIVMLIPIAAPGGNMDDVVKKAESELRKTDMELKTGGHKKVSEKLPEIDKLVSEVQSKEPNHPRLANLISSLKNQKDKVEAKLGIALTLKTDLTSISKKADPGAAAESPKPAPREKVNFSDPSYGKIKREDAGEAQARREAKREEERKQDESATKKGATKAELYEYYTSKLYDPVQVAQELPGNDVERHLEATEKIAAEMPTIRKLLSSHKEYADDTSYRDLETVAEKAAEWRVAAAQKLASNANSMMSFPRNSKGGDVGFDMQIAEVKKTLAFAARYDANQPEIKKLRDEIAVLEKGANAKVASMRWEGNKNAPANAAGLVAAGMKFFTGEKGWADKYTVLAVAIRGQWTVQKKNIVGAPILYGIPVHLAVQKDEDKKLRQVRVFDGTLITVEKEGVKPEPPFDGFYVGQNWLVNGESVK
jgi:hypothetical protein